MASESEREESRAEPGQPVRLSIEAVESVNFAMHQNDVPVVRSVRIENASERTLRDLRVRISASRPIFTPWESRLDALAPGLAHRLDSIDLALDPNVLCNQAERERLRLDVEILAGEEPLASAAAPLDLLAFNEWTGAGGLSDLIAAFVTPNHPSVEALVAETRDALGRMTGDPSLSGYQAQDPARVSLTVQAAASAFRAREIGYVNPPASFERTGQKVRSADQVLDGRLGTCLDLAVVFASILEQIGLHPLIVLLKGHAFVGVWLRPERFPQTVVDDRAIVLKRVQLREMMLIETVALVAGVSADFRSVQEQAERRLLAPDEFVCVVDLAACRREGIRPLPSRLSVAGGYQVAPAETNPTPGASVVEQPVESAAPRERSGRTRRAGESLPADFPAEAGERLEVWKRKLLDLSLRNRLLNYKETKRSVPLLVPDAAAFEDLLADGQRFRLSPRAEALGGARDAQAESRRVGTDAEKRKLLELMREGRLASSLAPADLSARLLQIYRDARTSIEESGMSTLYVAVGSLVWYQSESSDVPLVAPLVLVPAVLQRDVAGQEFSLERADEEVRVNVTLLEMLREQFGIDGSHLARLEQDDSGYDIRSMINGFIELVKAVPRWEVREDAVLSHFSFAKFMMWADLEVRSAQIASNKVVRRLLDRASPVPLAEIEPINEPDRPTPPGGPVPALDADSSQLAAVHAAMGGRTFVLQGPPGTGKSQTITNMLASAIASGKRVLFVAEKMAALSVVKSRLARLGLGPFCLELHSTKSGKREVMNQLREALETPREAEPGEWAERVREVESAREELHGYARALHSVRESGETVYGAIGRAARLSGAPRVNLPISEPARVTRESLARMREKLAELVRAASAAGELATHPLRGLGVRAWRPGLADEIRESAERLEQRALELRDAAAGMLALLGDDPAQSQSRADDLTASELAWLTKVASMLLKGGATNESALHGRGFSDLKARVSDEIALGARTDEAFAALSARYRETLLTADLAGMQAAAQRARASGWPMRWFRTRGVLAALRAHALDPQAPIADPLADILAASQVRDARARLSAPDCAGRSLIGARWGTPGAWAEASRTLEWLEQMRTLLASRPEIGALEDATTDAVVRLACAGEERLAPGAPARGRLERMGESARAFDEAFAALKASGAVRRSEIADDQTQGLLGLVVGAVRRWLGALDLLPDWCAWREAEALEGAPELAMIARALAEGKLAPGDARAAFERSFALLWLADVFKGDAMLSRFSLSRQTLTVERFRASDEALVRLGATVVKARRQQAAPAPTIDQANPDSELGVLKRQLALQRRHMPVRRLIEKLPNVLPRLKPCWLMSPLSVAQYLDPKLPPFDLVVFDEASQIPAWDAIGALARGAEAVIVGDSKQLPPTNFFDKVESGEAEDDSDFAELESILDEATASNLPTLSLRWHYRSRHESLIAFSNHHYYDNTLLTFPSPEATVPGLGVSMVYLPEGRYDKAGSRTNRLEAEAVVAEVVRRLTSEDRGRFSLGVVTFSMAQQRLVEDLLDAQRRAHPEIERFFGSGVDEPVFVKNLENVQGDERDVILFSICYGPHGEGQVSMNFGPINRQGGERRLNVAITRARREVMVFSSLRPEQIDLSRTRATGAAHLRSFLDYALRGPRAILEAARPGESTESPFEEAVREALVARGHLVDVQVGCSGYRIDLAIKDPACPGRYVLGIECDGASYHSSRSARDRDRLREQVLRGLGWRLHRVWSTDWFQSPERALARIESAIAQALTAQTTPPASPPPPPSPPSSPSPPSTSTAPSSPTSASHDAASDSAPAAEPPPLKGSEEYAQAKLPRARRESEALREGRALAQVADDVVAIVNQESPVHADRVRQAIAEAWGIERLTARAREVIDRAIDQARTTGGLSADGEFLLGPVALGAQFRVPSAREDWSRPIEQIHPAELAAAARAILERDFSMPIDSLCAEVARLFGAQRVTARLEPFLRAGIDTLARSGRCRIEGETVSI
ncbi:MAG: DUF3320 domain-containing protein [Planctomycetota bacterium]|nr:DUF3320 domain-containing protein [Planctomycetota bacterium]